MDYVSLKHEILILKYFSESIHYKKMSDGLWIDRVNRSNSGTYVCKAVQKTSQEIIGVRERDIRLDVLCKC